MLTFSDQTVAFTMNQTEREALGLIQVIAESARSELGSRAANGSKARPTVDQLNRTLERLSSIIRLAEGVLA
jgi:hypothetical protein